MVRRLLVEFACWFIAKVKAEFSFRVTGRHETVAATETTNGPAALRSRFDHGGRDGQHLYCYRQQ